MLTCFTWFSVPCLSTIVEWRLVGTNQIVCTNRSTNQIICIVFYTMLSIRLGSSTLVLIQCNESAQENALCVTKLTVNGPSSEIERVSKYFITGNIKLRAQKTSHVIFPCYLVFHLQVVSYFYCFPTKLVPQLLLLYY